MAEPFPENAETPRCPFARPARQAHLPPARPLLPALPRFVLQLLRSHGNLAEAFRRWLIQLGVKSRVLKLGRFQVLVTVDPQVARWILTEEPELFPKSDWERRVLHPVMEGGLIILQNEQWRRHHKVLAGCFGSAFIHRLPELVLDSAQARMRAWGHSPQPLNVSREIRCIVNEVMRRYFLDCDLGEPPWPIRDIEELSAAYVRIERLLEVRVFDPFRLRERFHDRFDRPGFGETVHRVTRAISGPVETRASRGNNTPLAHLVAGLGSRQEAVGEIRTLIAAGLTTGHLLSWLMLLLADSRRVQTRLREEVTTALSGRTDARALSLNELESMEYLTAVVHEGLRLYPPAPFLLRRVLGAGDRQLAFIPIWAMHRHPDFWESPDDFVPERWLNQETVPLAFTPFGAGHRVCIGKRFAMIETRLILFETVRCFDIARASRRPVPPVMEILTRPRSDVRLRLTALS